MRGAEPLLRAALAGVATIILCLATAPLDSAAQGAAVIVLMGIMWYGRTALRETDEGFWRIITIVIGLFITLRYLVWRGLYTLDSHNAADLAATLVLYGAELYSSGLHFLGCTLNLPSLRREELTLADLAPGTALPSVDILVPTYNEDPALLEVTLRAALALRYPGGRRLVYLCDDGGTAQKLADPDPAKAAAARARRATLQALCARLGATYLTRRCNLHAKAGNLNSALKHCSGDLVVIFDADHVPTVDFLDHTVAWFVRHDDVFLVQTPHFMINPDPIDRNLLDAFSRMPSENDMFYMTMQRGLDFWSSSFFCGSAAVLRRRCLDEVGGIAGQSITEDAETTLSLHERGYRSVYVCRPMVAGLAPETFTSFVVQRMRWAQGMIQILLLKKPYLMPGLKWHQKLGYMSSLLFWLFPFARIAFLFGPLANLLFGLEVYNASIAEIVTYTLPNIFAIYMLSNLLFGQTRWPLISELYELMQCFFSLRAIIEVLRNPRKPQFMVTPKNQTLEKAFISPLSRPFYWTFALLCLGALSGIYRLYAYPLTRDLTAVAFIWNLFNLIIVFSSLGALVERRQCRAAPRMPVDEEGALSWNGAFPQSCHLDNLSAGGALVLVADRATAPLPGDLVELAVHSYPLGRPVRLKCRVRSLYPWRGRIGIGLQFEPDDEDMANDAVLFAFGDSERWAHFQRRRLRKIPFFMALRMFLNLIRNPGLVHFAMLRRAFTPQPPGIARLIRFWKQSRPVEQPHV